MVYWEAVRLSVAATKFERYVVFAVRISKREREVFDVTSNRPPTFDSSCSTTTTTFRQLCKEENVHPNQLQMKTATSSRWKLWKVEGVFECPGRGCMTIEARAAATACLR
jgi:hypothetical protein